MNDVRFGLIGCGTIGPSLARGVAEANGAELVACADLVAENARDLADEHDCDPYTDHGEMLAGADVEAALVATPSGTHGGLTVDCAEAGVHVLCQKPLEVKTERLDRMIAACEDADVRLGGLFDNRFRPGTRRIKRAVEEGEFGELHLANAIMPTFRPQSYYDSGEWRGTRDMDGGCLFNQGVHMIDRIQWLVGDFERVYADLGTVAHDMECEDVATATVRFEGGVRGLIEGTTAVHSQHHSRGGRVELYGEDGYAVVSHSEVLEFETAELGEVEVEGSYGKSAFGLQIQDFAGAIQEDREPAVTGEEARKAPDAIIAMYESADRDEPLRVDEVREELGAD